MKSIAALSILRSGAYLLLGVATATAASTSYTFSTLGSIHGNVDGTGTAARLDDPHGVAVDRNGNLFVADTDTIRKITPAGVVTTFAGSPGQAGHDDGTGSAARFSVLLGLAIDSSDNLYAISGNAVRKITPAGVVTTIAGNGAESGLNDGIGVAARFNGAAGIAVDGLGNIFVSETWQGKIRKITPQGAVSLFVGVQSFGGDVDGPAAFAVFNQPRGLATDVAGNLYVATNGKIRKVTPAGDVTTVAGSFQGFADGTGNAAAFFFPEGLAVDAAGNIFVADTFNGLIRKVTPSGTVSTFAGTYPLRGQVDGVGPAARFTSPSGIAVDAAGKLYVSDTSTDTIRTISTSASVATLAGSLGHHLDGPTGTALFQRPFGLGQDTMGNVFVADWLNQTIRKISPAGMVTTVAGAVGESGSTDGARADARFRSPYDVAGGRDGSLFVIDAGNSTIRKIAPDGTVSTFAGAAGQTGTADGVGSAARFQSLQRIAIDAQQNIFVTDSTAHTIRRITPDGTVTTLAGSAGLSGYTDGMGAAARFISPRGIAIRPNGNLIVADNGAQTIREITPQGLVTTLAGVGGQDGISDGVGSEARFSLPNGVSIDADDNIYVSQLTAISTVRKISPAGMVTTEFSATDAGWKNGVWFDLLVDSGGAILMADETISVIRKASPPGAGLVNIAARGYCSTGDRVMIGGFVVSGSVPKRVLIRAVGPSLVAQGISASEALVDPLIEVHHGATVIASNDNWSDAINAAEITTTAAQIGATAFTSTDTKSSALLLTLDPGVYSFIASGKSGMSGVVLLEAYDADAVTTGSNFVNIATRAYSTTGNGVTIGGFVISGNVSKQILLRAVGPTLTAQGINDADVLVDPMIELHQGAAVINANDNWGENANAAAITTTGARIGATPFATSDTTSSALLLTLQPGVYSFIASGKSSTSGVVLVEVYDAD